MSHKNLPNCITDHIMIESRDINGQLNSGIVFKEKIHLTEIAESFLSHNMTAL